MLELFKSGTLLLVLLNPFLVIIYLTALVRELDGVRFARTLLGGGVIAWAVFWAFAVLGDAVFSEFMKVEFASFQIFGGVVFLLIGLQFVFKGPGAIEMLRGDAANLAGAVAMPVLIGPGTISASVLIGQRLSPLSAAGAIFLAVFGSLGIMIALKLLHDWVRSQHEALIERYIEVAGRITALYVGTVAVEMVMRGAMTWSTKF